MRKSLSTKRILILNISCIVVVLINSLISYGGISYLRNHYTKIVNEALEDSRICSETVKLIHLQTHLIDNFIVNPQKFNIQDVINQTHDIQNKLELLLEQQKDLIEDSSIAPIFSVVYNACTADFNTIDELIKVVNEGNIERAVAIFENEINSNSEHFTENLVKYRNLSRLKIEKLSKKLDSYLFLMRILLSTASILVTIAFFITIITSMKALKRLKAYRDRLKKEIIRKNRELIFNKEHLIQIQNNTIMGIANLIENRDGETGEHVKRTSLYVELLAQEAKRRGYYADILTEHYIAMLVKAAPLHDVGKIVVSDTILRKPGKLTSEEFEVIKRHASEGGKIVREVLNGIEENEYVEIASEIATSHHEKWNGEGYPNNLKGESIPLGARIMAIADVFDALVSPRCYKKPIPTEDAFAIMEESSGSHFDPVLAHIFIDVKPRVLNIFYNCSN